MTYITMILYIYMLNLNSLMVGTMQPKVMIEFYEKVFDKKPDMTEGEWAGWQVGATFFGVGHHSKMEGKSKKQDVSCLTWKHKM